MAAGDDPLAPLVAAGRESGLLDPTMPTSPWGVRNVLGDSLDHRLRMGKFRSAWIDALAGDVPTPKSLKLFLLPSDDRYAALDTNASPSHRLHFAGDQFVGAAWLILAAQAAGFKVHPEALVHARNLLSLGETDPLPDPVPATVARLERFRHMLEAAPKTTTRRPRTTPRAEPSMHDEALAVLAKAYQHARWVPWGRDATSGDMTWWTFERAAWAEALQAASMHLADPKHPALVYLSLSPIKRRHLAELGKVSFKGDVVPVALGAAKAGFPALMKGEPSFERLAGDVRQSPGFVDLVDGLAALMLELREAIARNPGRDKVAALLRNDTPRPEGETRGVGREDYDERREQRADRLEDAADRKQAEAAERWEQSRGRLEGIPMGQPILVGHHSQRRHERAIERSHADARKSIEASNEAARLASAAQAARENRSISSDDPEAVRRLREKIDAIEKQRERLREFKRAVESDTPRESLVALGVSERMIAEFLKPLYGGTGVVGVPSYLFSNSAAELRRLKKRLEELETRSVTAKPEDYVQGEARAEWDADTNRVLVKLPEVPKGEARKARAKLMKSAGFVWAPSTEAWQRKANESAWYHARRMVDEIMGVPPQPPAPPPSLATPREAALAAAAGDPIPLAALLTHRAAERRAAMLTGLAEASEAPPESHEARKERLRLEEMASRMATAKGLGPAAVQEVEDDMGLERLAAELDALPVEIAEYDRPGKKPTGERVRTTLGAVVGERNIYWVLKEPRGRDIAESRAKDVWSPDVAEGWSIVVGELSDLTSRYDPQFTDKQNLVKARVRDPQRLRFSKSEMSHPYESAWVLTRRRARIAVPASDWGNAIGSLRKVDVERVLRESLPVERKTVASVLRQARPELVTEIDEVMAELAPTTISTPSAPEPVSEPAPPPVGALVELNDGRVITADEARDRYSRQKAALAGGEPLDPTGDYGKPVAPSTSSIVELLRHEGYQLEIRDGARLTVLSPPLPPRAGTLLLGRVRRALTNAGFETFAPTRSDRRVEASRPDSEDARHAAEMAIGELTGDEIIDLATGVLRPVPPEVLAQQARLLEVEEVLPPLFRGLLAYGLRTGRDLGPAVAWSINVLKQKVDPISVDELLHPTEAAEGLLATAPATATTEAEKHERWAMRSGDEILETDPDAVARLKAKDAALSLEIKLWARINNDLVQNSPASALRALGLRPAEIEWVMVPASKKRHSPGRGIPVDDIRQAGDLRRKLDDRIRSAETFASRQPAPPASTMPRPVSSVPQQSMWGVREEGFALVSPVGSYGGATGPGTHQPALFETTPQTEAIREHKIEEQALRASRRGGLEAYNAVREAHSLPRIRSAADAIAEQEAAANEAVPVAMLPVVEPVAPAPPPVTVVSKKEGKKMARRTTKAADDPEARMEAYLDAPSLDAWKKVSSLIIPGTMRTMWQAWRGVDGGAPTRGPFTTFPDAFTMRRGIRAAREGKTPVGLGKLEAERAIVPRGEDIVVEANRLLADGERIRSNAAFVSSGDRERFGRRFANQVGFWVRVPGTNVYRTPPRGAPPDEPTARERATALAELRDILATASRMLQQWHQAPHVVAEAIVPGTIMLTIAGKPPLRMLVGSLGAASEEYRNAAETSGQGASTFPRGHVRLPSGETYEVSFNGRVWDGERLVFDPHAASEPPRMLSAPPDLASFKQRARDLGEAAAREGRPRDATYKQNPALLQVVKDYMATIGAAANTGQQHEGPILGAFIGGYDAAAPPAVPPNGNGKNGAESAKMTILRGYAANPPTDVAGWSERITALYAVRMRPISKVFGSRGPSPAQAKEYAAEKRLWDSLNRKARKEHARLLKASNAAVRAREDKDRKDVEQSATANRLAKHIKALRPGEELPYQYEGEWAVGHPGELQGYVLIGQGTWARGVVKSFTTAKEAAGYVAGLLGEGRARELAAAWDAEAEAEANACLGARKAILAGRLPSPGDIDCIRARVLSPTAVGLRLPASRGGVSKRDAAQAVRVLQRFGVEVEAGELHRAWLEAYKAVDTPGAALAAMGEGNTDLSGRASKAAKWDDREDWRRATIAAFDRVRRQPMTTEEQAPAWSSVQDMMEILFVLGLKVGEVQDLDTAVWTRLPPSARGEYPGDWWPPGSPKDPDKRLQLLDLALPAADRKRRHDTPWAEDVIKEFREAGLAQLREAAPSDGMFTNRWVLTPKGEKLIAAFKERRAKGLAAHAVHMKQRRKESDALTDAAEAAARGKSTPVARVQRKAPEQNGGRAQARAAREKAKADKVTARQRAKAEKEAAREKAKAEKATARQKAKADKATERQQVRAAKRSKAETAKTTAAGKSQRVSGAICAARAKERASRKLALRDEREAHRLVQQHKALTAKLDEARAPCAGGCKHKKKALLCSAPFKLRELSKQLQAAQQRHAENVARHLRASEALKTLGIDVPALSVPAYPRRRDGAPPRAKCGTVCHIQMKDGLCGAQATILLPPAQGMPREVLTRYCLVEADTLITSHDPVTFHVDPRYPEAVQERRYEADEGEQIGVINIAQNGRPELVFSTAATPLEGTPIVTVEGIVLGGNKRTMGMKRAFKAGKTLYRDYLIKVAHEFGFTAAQVRKMREPIVVRTIDPPRSEWARYSRDLNQGLTQSLDVLAEAVSLARVLPPAALTALAEGLAEEDIHDFFGTEASLPFIRALEHGGVITAQNRSRFLDPNGLLSKEGREVAIRQLGAAVLPNAQLLSLLGPEIVATLARAAPYLLAAAAQGGEWDVRPPLDRAGRDYLAIRALDKPKHRATPRQYFSQQGVFGNTPHSHKHPIALRMLVLLAELHGKPAQFAKLARFFASEAELASGPQSTLLLQPKTPAQALDAAADLVKVDLADRVAELMPPET